MRVDDLTEDESAAGLPDLARIVLPRTPDDVRANERLHRVVARHCLVRFLRAPRRLGDAVPGPAPALALAGETLDALEVDATLDLASRPDLTGWIWRSGVAGADPVVLLAELESCLTRDAGAAVARVVFTAPQARRVSVPVLARSGPDRGGLLFSWAAESESDERPLGHLLHGVLSFISGLHAARCRRERTADAREQERIGRHLTERAAQPLLAENNLTEVAEPTAEGARLLAGCREAVECLRRG
ncbi:hypothetical protein ACIOWG_24305 [Streptomyces sp. NPDC087658]|uniref:hypothetical protein n=1 Tax=Streptomyces sp. NPDC087658 TaxID=3365800 RepID=UPI00381ADD1B